MPTLPTLRQLGYLVELSERLNFRVAAEAQFVTQSTLSAGIKELETVLGVQLVERDNRNVRLTAVGEDVVARARDLLAAATDLSEAARSAARPLSGPLRLGAIPTIAPYLLPGVLPALRRAYGELIAMRSAPGTVAMAGRMAFTISTSGLAESSLRQKATSSSTAATESRVAASIHRVFGIAMPAASSSSTVRMTFSALP